MRKFQSRRSVLIWKVYGERLDGWLNDDFPTAQEPGNAETLQLAGEAVPNTQSNRNRSDLDFRGGAMPPADAVRSGKVERLSNEDRRTLARWIDLGCPIDFDYDESAPDRRGSGWACDDKRPTLTLTEPRPGLNRGVDRFLIGAADYYSGIAPESLSVIASFDVPGHPAGSDLASEFKRIGRGIFELRLPNGIADAGEYSIKLSVRDRQGNVTVIDRHFWIGATRR